MSKRWVFGYGSLLNLASVQETVPEISQLLPCTINGFTRDFSYWSETGFVVTNLDVGGTPFYALNVRASPYNEERINGIIFEVNEDQFDNLAMREHGYNLVETTAYEFTTGDALEPCILYSAPPHKGEAFEVSSAAQLRYLQICLEGAKTLGPDFYQMFLDTTYIAGHKLSEIPELSTLIA